MKGKCELTTDICLVISYILWEAIHERKARVSELGKDAQVALGKKVFEYLNYRDKYYPHITGEYVYEGCLADHNIQRDRPDVIDMKKRYPHGFTEQMWNDYKSGEQS